MSLLNINTVECSKNILLLKRGNIFSGQLKSGTDVIIDLLGSGNVRSTKGKVVNLTAKENSLVLDGSAMNVAFIGGRTKSERGKCLGNMPLPRVRGFQDDLGVHVE
jgi:hypothetical protein